LPASSISWVNRGIILLRTGSPATAPAAPSCLAWQPSAWYVGGEAGTYSAWVRRLDATATTAWTWQEPDASAFALQIGRRRASRCSAGPRVGRAAVLLGARAVAPRVRAASSRRRCCSARELLLRGPAAVLLGARAVAPRAPAVLLGARAVAPRVPWRVAAVRRAGQGGPPAGRLVIDPRRRA